MKKRREMKEDGERKGDIEKEREMKGDGERESERE